MAETTTSIPQSEKAVLLLDNDNKPMVISFDGEVNNDIAFEFVGNALVKNGCAATLNGKFFYFGGSNFERKTKVSRFYFSYLNYTR